MAEGAPRARSAASRRLSFRQVFVEPDRAEGRPAGRPEQLLARLRAAGPDAADRRPRRRDDAARGDAARSPLREVAAVFGDDFARRLAEAPRRRVERPARVLLRPPPRPRPRARRARGAEPRRGPPARRARDPRRAAEEGARRSSTNGSSRSTRSRSRCRRSTPAPAPGRRGRGTVSEAASSCSSRRRALALAVLAATGERPRGPPRLPRAARDGARRPTRSSGRSRPAARSRSPIAPVIPDGCRLSTPDRQQLTPGAFVVRGTLTCAGGLAGKTIAIAGLETTVTDVLVRLHHADGRLESHLLRPANPSVTLGGVTSATERALRLRPARRPAHPARRRPPALRPRAAADRLGPLDAGEDDHVVHRGPQHHAGDRDARLRERAAAAAQRRDRAQHPLPRPGDRPRLARARRASRSATRGSWRSRSACSTASASRAGLTRDGPAEGRDPARAPPLQRRRRDRAGRVRPPRRPPRALVPRPRGPLAARRRAAAGLRRRDARGLLDDPADARFSSGGRDDSAARSRDPCALAAAALARPRPRPRRAGARRGLPRGPPPPGLRPRPRPRDGRRRALGRAARSARRSGCCRSRSRW